MKKQGAHAVDYREVVYDTRLASSYSTFGRSFDLFGDGSVRLVYTPGPLGRAPVADRAAEGPRGAARRATRSTSSTRSSTSVAAPFLDDEHNWRRSLREIQLYRRQNPDALIIPSHDDKLWARLEPVYA